MIGTCFKESGFIVASWVHGCQALISDRNVFKESGFIVASWVHGCQALISDRNVFKESGFIVASWGTWLPSFN